MMELDERLLAYERVRVVSAEWSEMLTGLLRFAQQMHDLGESNHAHAILLDHQHLLRRAQLHVRQVAAQEAARGVSTRPPPMHVVETAIPKLKAL